MSGILRWMSQHEVGLITGPFWSVEAFVPRIRKRVALVRRDGTESRVVAYFCDEADAEEFALQVLGGVRPLIEK